MPYRRLPNTDAARIRALKAALKKGQYLEIDTIAYPFALKQKIEFFLPKFEVAIPKKPGFISLILFRY